MTAALRPRLIARFLDGTLRDSHDARGFIERYIDKKLEAEDQ